ncbi:hypothetical protein BJY04DRAFT_214306 [Aspergillus karnatakaensis]|uniref:huntingtin-interacting protein K n=1 Tax=Aspergillus karnatakaensis TaxID=1810916 RepID=UPI003CCD438F
MSDPTPAPTSTSAEDRKAAAALSSLNTTEIASSDSSANTKQPSNADQEALGKAMSRLEIAAGKGGSGASSGVGASGAKGKGNGDGSGKAAEGVKKVNVKVLSEDVTLLVSELDLSKIKATELLKSNGGDAKMAIRAFITSHKTAVEG